MKTIIEISINDWERNDFEEELVHLKNAHKKLLGCKIEDTSCGLIKFLERITADYKKAKELQEKKTLVRVKDGEPKIEVY